MIVGVVSANGLPTVRLPVAGQDWSATIDTGFNGDLELPETLRTVMNPRFLGTLHSFLAGGQTVEEVCYRVDFPFDGITLTADATFVADAEILIGTHLLRFHRLEVNFPAAMVRVERVS